MTVFFACITATIIFLQLTKHWFLYKGNLKVVYYLNILAFICYFITESTVAFNNPNQWPLFFMNIVNVFAIIMSVKGIMRLKEEAKNNTNSTGVGTKPEVVKAAFGTISGVAASLTAPETLVQKPAPATTKTSMAQKDWEGRFK